METLFKNMKIKIHEKLESTVLKMAKLNKVSPDALVNAAVCHRILLSFLPQEQQDTITQWVKDHREACN